jgi:hypothetical protein
MRRLCQRHGVLEALPALPRLLAPLESIRRVLFGKLKIQGQTLANLENNKGSDASAAQATRSAIATAKQIISLHSLIRPVRAAAQSSGNGEAPGGPPATPAVAVAAHHISLEWMREITGDGSLWVPRNTIVRDVFKEVLHSHDLQLPVLSPASPEEAAAAAQSGHQRQQQQRPEAQVLHPAAAQKPAQSAHGIGGPKAVVGKGAGTRVQQVAAARLPLQPTNGRKVFRLNMES